MNFKDLLKAMQLIEDDRKISKEVVKDALKEALAKAYRKHVDIPDILVRVDISDATGKITVYQQYLVVTDVEDEELEISLVDAKELNPEIELGGFIEKEVSINELGRAAALLAKNVMKQKIREAEKQAVYDEYIDLLDEMVLGIIESVEEKFILVNLGKTIALMPKGAQIPGERYQEGQKIRVVITECNKDTKGSQVLVSRADAKLVKRLFEKEVPEIYQGIVEIRGIAREAGERTKMAVYSKNPDVDPRGACIGPRGQRVQEISDELNGEKIDIFEWSENTTELVKNALAPAEVIAVVPTDEKRSLMVIVDNSQLSLAIGKKGKNARLAVKLTNMKIDIKTKEELIEQGVDFDKLMFDYEVEQEKIKRELASKAIAEMEEEFEIEAIEEKEELHEEETEVIVETTEEIEEAVVETVVVTETVEPVQEVKKVEPKPEAPVEKVVKKVKKEPKVRTDYVSVFEKLADTSKPKVEKPDFKKRKKKDEEERKLRSIDIKKDKDYDIKPVYSEEELEEIRMREEKEALEAYNNEIDYDEFEEYYDED
ncbi:transcription termination factor NusA [Anaerorhabdus furcosa]|uniref:Transcription termination/antitermination protein NusA n=1 Tax=Anaerorhabdus furcosa TaxID=118967 RepID=A0A1T4Q1R6_9FIRM|nr:transcription termination factor NusA [Anaerorhabdus furcosa]SJZ97546.1 NusA antitermination factor [Anaerorhabdus furcosa]